MSHDRGQTRVRPGRLSRRTILKARAPPWPGWPLPILDHQERGIAVLRAKRSGASRLHALQHTRPFAP